MENTQILEVLKESLQIEGKEEIFTNELLESLSVVFEAKIAEHKSKVEEEVKAQLEEANKAEIVEFKEGLTTQLDEYLNYFVEKFLEENTEQIHDEVKVRTAERVLEKFEGLVQEFNIELDESTVSQDEEIDGLKEELNATINDKIALENEVKSFQKAQIISEESSKISIDSEKATFVKLAENFDYTDEETFKSKLGTLAESIKVTEVEEKVELEEQEVVESQETKLQESKTISKPVGTSHYLKHLAV